MTIPHSQGSFLPRRMSIFLIMCCLAALPLPTTSASASARTARRQLQDNSAPATKQKQVVFVAGPHSTGTSSIEKFFHRHVSGFLDLPIASSVSGWKWPLVVKRKPKHYQKAQALVADLTLSELHKVFGLLVTHREDAVVKGKIMTAIQNAYESVDEGIILASEEFDHVGSSERYKNESMSTESLALPVMQDIVSTLQVPNDHVTVVLEYRAPRLEQWASLFRHASQLFESNNIHYKKYMCSNTFRQHLWDTIDTAMNPLRLALAYREKGWNVVLIDMEGVTKAGRDLVHVIGCNVLKGTTCTEGWMADFVNMTYHDSESDQKEIHSLSTFEQGILEQAFRERDCFYQGLIQNDFGIRVLYHTTLWLSPHGACSAKPADQMTYEGLSDPYLMFDIVRSQKKCATKTPDLEKVLVGTIDPKHMVETKISAVEGILSGDDNGLHSNEKQQSPFIVAVFLLVIVGASFYQVLTMYRLAKNDDGDMASDDHVELEQMQMSSTNGGGFSDKNNNDEFHDEM